MEVQDWGTVHAGTFSVLRNPIVVNVFNRIGIIEASATGIKRTNNAYRDYSVKPSIDVDEFGVHVILPTIDFQRKMNSKDCGYLELLNPNIKYSRAELEMLLRLSKDSLIKVLNRFSADGLLEKRQRKGDIVFSKNNFRLDKGFCG